MNPLGFYRPWTRQTVTAAPFACRPEVMMSLRRTPARRLSAATAVLLGLIGSVVAVALAGPASAATDLAVGKTATADSTEVPRLPTMANDADPSTRWCAADGKTGHWWQVDLASQASLTGTQVVWEFARSYQYRIEVSTDGSAWTTVVDRTADTTAEQTESDAFTATARYVRITVTGLAPGSWASIVSFSVFGTPGTAIPPSTPFKGVANSPCADIEKLNVAWYYNWGLASGKCGAEFVPMISGRTEKTADDVRSAVTKVAAAGYHTVLGFNEPNKASQSNLTVDQAIALWPELTAKGDIRVGSPATSSDALNTWFTDFMTRVDAKGLRVDFIAVHWYGWNQGSCSADAKEFEKYLHSVELITGNRPIWITELGCLNKSNVDAKQVQDFYAGVLTVLARHPRVERYAWYPWIGNHALTDGSGSLTPLGTAYAAAPAYR